MSIDDDVLVSYALGHLSPEDEAAVAEHLRTHPEDAARVAGSVAWAEERCTIGGLLHGGVLMAFADSLGAVCAFLNLPPGALDVRADPLSFTGAATSQVAAVVARVAEITAAHPDAAAYTPGAIL